MARELKKTNELKNTYVDEKVAYLLPIFEKLAPFKMLQRKNGVKGAVKIRGWENLACDIADDLMAKYPDNKETQEETYSTCLRQITALKKELKIVSKTQLKDPALYHSVNTIITNFGNALSFLFRPYKKRLNTDYRETVEERRQKENRIEIDLSNALKIAREILLEVEANKNPDWKDVSCAVALATGRRMAEIHLSAVFTQIGEYKIAFQGQLKGKERKVKVNDKRIALRDVIFEIPTLLPADLVCLGLDWLAKNDKRFPPDEDTERVNRRWSKVLNLAAKDWDIFPEDERTYHKFRAAYLRACIVNANEDSYDFTDYATSILGDNDEGTINSYKRYELKENSPTKISK